MARKKVVHSEEDTVFDSAGARITDIPLHDEASKSFLEYSYSVITSRALPDARDGLKPVHRRILFAMNENGLRPDHSYVKSARVVGDTMGKYHPHGDSAIYEALVRLTQDFSLNTPLIDGHGNFGSPNDGPAASRYTECRMASPAMLLVGELDEGTVNMLPNYDGSLEEPSVLPAAFPNLLVNGSSGIAVGMATNMIPHNMGEAIAAARLLIKKPKATLDDLMALLPGPDLPSGGLLLGLDEVRRAYEEGRGSVRIRAKANIEPLEGSRGRNQIVVTEIPYGVGTERIIEKIKEEIGKKRLQGISDVKDLSDRRYGTRLVVECKTGVNPSALLNDLYRLTPMETTFGIANLALVEGQPRTLGLREMLDVFLAHRYEVVTRRTQFRLDKAKARKHIVEGLLIALDAIDMVVKTIRASKDTNEAKTKLMTKFKLSDIQTQHILDMPLRRLVSLEVQALRGELADLNKAIAGFEKILGDTKELHKVVDQELAAVAEKFPTPRRTELIAGDLKEVLAAAEESSAPLNISDDPCNVILSATGILARTAVATEESESGKTKKGRAKHDAILASIPSTARSKILAISNKGRAFKVDVISLPALPQAAGTLSLRGGMPVREVALLNPGEHIVGIAPISSTTSPGIALGTKNGIVKVASYDVPTRGDDFEIINLKGNDEVVGATWLSDGNEELVFVTSDASLLHFPAKNVRPQGRNGGGMAGIKLGSSTVVGFTAVHAAKGELAPQVVTYTGSSIKVTPLAEYPGKGRATGGVRAHKFLKGETALTAAWITSAPVACTDKGEPLDLPAVDKRRDGSGAKTDPIAAVGQLILRP